MRVLRCLSSGKTFISFSLGVLLVLLLHIPASTQQKFFYQNDTSGVLEMHTPEFFEYLKYSPTAWIVEFYSPLCGLCRQFSAVWRRLALLTAGWRKVLRVGAMNCGIEPNILVCRKLGIYTYPVVKLFPPSMEDAYNHAVDVPDPWVLTELELSDRILEYVSQVRESLNRTDFPYLGLSTGQEALQELCHSRVLIFEDPFNPDPNTIDLAKRTIMEASKGVGIRVHRILGSDPMAMRYGVNATPSAVICINENRCILLPGELDPPSQILQRLMHWTVDNGLPPQRWAVETCAGESVLRDPEDRVLDEDPSIIAAINYQTQAQPSFSTASPITQAPRPKPKPQRRVYLKDLDNAIAFALRNEVLAQPVLDGEPLSALKNFVVVLLKYYPGKPKTVDAIESILHWITAQEGPISMVDWRAFLEYLGTREDRILPKESRYVGCKGSMPGLRGYPCSLWMLFHTLLMEAHEEEDGNSVEVLRAMHGYITNFFTCRPCREHFDEMAQMDGLFQVTNNTEAVMWLWRAHNKVNERLAGNLATEDPDYPKTQFPPAEMCSSCMIEVDLVSTTGEKVQDKKDEYTFSHISSDGVVTRTVAARSRRSKDRRAITWDEAEVLDYLRWFYVLTGDPLVINVRTNVSDEQRREALEKWPSLKGRKKKAGEDSATDREDYEGLGGELPTNSSANRMAVPGFQPGPGLSASSMVALVVISFASTILVFSIPHV